MEILGRLHWARYAHDLSQSATSPVQNQVQFPHLRPRRDSDLLGEGITDEAQHSHPMAMCASSHGMIMAFCDPKSAVLCHNRKRLVGQKGLQLGMTSILACPPTHLCCTQEWCRKCDAAVRQHGIGPQSAPRRGGYLRACYSRVMPEGGGDGICDGNGSHDGKGDVRSWPRTQETVCRAAFRTWSSTMTPLEDSCLTVQAETAASTHSIFVQRTCVSSR